MDNPEPNPNILNLQNQYISLLIKDGFSNAEAESLANVRFKKLKDLRQLNPDKLSWFMRTKNLTDENIYIYMMKLISDESDKIDVFQKQR